MNTSTYQILQEIGSPFINSNINRSEIDFEKLYLYSKKNKMPILYLRSIIESGYQKEDYKDYIVLKETWVEIEKRIKLIIKILDSNNIKYTTFKSIKPYNEVTVDIDLLIFNNYTMALDELKEAGYKMLLKGPLSSTFRDPNFKIDYDIYDEVGVSNIIYFDKEKSTKYIFKKSLQTGGYIDSLTPSLDLLAVIAHSVIKEQMYTLAEYYTTLYYLSSMKREEMDTFIEMANVLKLKNAVRAHIGLTCCIHRMAYGVIPPPIHEIVSKFGIDGFEAERAKQSGYNTPHKFHPLTLMKCFSEKIQESKARRSFALQAQSMMSPNFMRSFLPKFLSHVTRITY